MKLELPLAGVQRGRRIVLAILGLAALVVVVWVAGAGWRFAVLKYYVRLLRADDVNTRRRAADALASLGGPSVIPDLVASIPWADDCHGLYRAISAIRRGADLSTGEDDPAALAVLRLGRPGAAALERTLRRLDGCQKGWAVLLAATVGLSDVAVEPLVRIALSEEEAGAVNSIAILALGTMGQGGADALVGVVEALEYRGRIRERPSDWAGDSPGLDVSLCFEARLRGASAYSQDAAALCEVLGMPEEPMRWWKYRVELIARTKGALGDWVFLFQPRAEADPTSWRPVVVGLTREFQLLWWRALDELPGLWHCEIILESDCPCLRVRGVRATRREERSESREVRVCR